MLSCPLTATVFTKQRKERSKNKASAHGRRTNLALRSSLPVTSFLLSTNGNLLLTTIMLPLEVKPGSVDIFDVFSDQLSVACAAETRRHRDRRCRATVSLLFVGADSVARL